MGNMNGQSMHNEVMASRPAKAPDTTNTKMSDIKSGCGMMCAADNGNGMTPKAGNTK